MHSSPLAADAIGALLEGVDVGVWHFAADWGPLFASPSARRLLGALEHEPQRYGEWIARVHPEDRERVSDEIRSARSTPGPFTLEVRVVARDGAIRWLEVRGRSVHEGGRLAHAFGTVQDATLRKEPESFRDLLIATLGHDLRDPLTAIQVGTAFLIRSARLEERQSRVANRVLASAERVSGMVEQLLDYARLGAGRAMPCTRRIANVGTIATRVIDEIELGHPSRKIDLVRHGDLDGQWDSDRLAQAIANLVSNAVLHGDPASAVTVSVAGSADTVELSVHNFGPEISQDALPGIFNPFKRKAPSSAKKGLGLGLFIAHEVVRSHGGSIRVSSTRLGGTCFTAVLPREPEN